MKYKKKYEKEKGKAMLDFETPTYVSAKEAQHMQSQVSPTHAQCSVNNKIFPRWSVFAGRFQENLTFNSEFNKNLEKYSFTLEHIHQKFCLYMYYSPELSMLHLFS